MKKLFYTIILGMFFCPLIAQEFTTKMETIYTSEKSYFYIQHIKSAIDSKNNIHCVFMNSDGNLFYGTNKSGAWKFEKLQYLDTENNETLDITKYPNIAIDKNDKIHVVTFDRYGEKLVYGNKAISANELKLHTVEISPKPLRFNVYGEYSDLAADDNGGLHLICRSDYTDKQEFKYNQCATYFNKKTDSDKWYLQILIHDTQWDKRNWAYGVNSSIACFEDNVYAAIGGFNELHFGTRNISGGTWDIKKLLYTPDKFINSGKDMLSLAISPVGSIKFAFYDRTDDTESTWHGLTIFSQNRCTSNKWMGYNGFKSPISLNCPAVAFDNNGKFYMANGQNSYALWHQACDCDGEYKKIYSDANKRTSYVDMVIDKKNTVYTFYTYENELNLLTVKPIGNTTNCNYPPSIVNYTGKTNLKPGEQWTATITATDPECDNITFESIIHNEMFSIKDHGNGAAIITATIPEGEGKGTQGLSIWALDEKHPDANDEVNVITFNLVITPEGQEIGSIKVKNKCTGGDNGIPLNSSTHSISKEQIQYPNKPNEKSDYKKQVAGTSVDVSNLDCEKFLDEYQAFSKKYIPIAKKVKTNPTDIQAAIKLGNMMEDYSSYATKWVTDSDCKDTPKYQERFEKITDEMEAAGQ